MRVMHSMLYMSTVSTEKIKACNALNAMYVDTVDTSSNYIVYHSMKSLNYNFEFNFELKPCINSNYNLFRIKALY